MPGLTCTQSSLAVTWRDITKSRTLPGGRFNVIYELFNVKPRYTESQFLLQGQGSSQVRQFLGGIK